MIHLLFLLHRYLGIGVGTLMVMWCLSGVVMMYQSYPLLDEATRVRHLAPIDWSGCCRISDRALADDESIEDLQLEVLAGTPVLQFKSTHGSRLINLHTGLAIDRVTTEQAAQVAATFTQGSAPAIPEQIALIDYDQWTVSEVFDSGRPLFDVAFGDDMGSHVYVSSATGRAVQLTTTRERFWNWLGSVPHWLYFAELRRNASLWNETVIATSLIGCFLAATGIYIGVRQWVRRPAACRPPYHGFHLWHHIAGLLFGVFALSWVLSGLLSVNPWGWLNGADGQLERTQLRKGPRPSGRQIKTALQVFAAADLPELVSLKIAPLDGKLYFVVTTTSGERHRLSVGAVPVPLNDADLDYVRGVLGRSVNARVLRLITQEDAYYFSHHRDRARLPVYRMVLADGTRYYVDAVSGTLIAKLDRRARAYRWLHEGLHRMDFTPGMRGRPQWDALMWVLMSGVTLLCMTGAYLGFRRLLRTQGNQCRSTK